MMTSVISKQDITRDFAQEISREGLKDSVTIETSWVKAIQNNFSWISTYEFQRSESPPPQKKEIKAEIKAPSWT